MVSTMPQRVLASSLRQVYTLHLWTSISGHVWSTTYTCSGCVSVNVKLALRRSRCDHVLDERSVGLNLAELSKECKKMEGSCKPCKVFCSNRVFPKILRDSKVAAFTSTWRCRRQELFSLPRVCTSDGTFKLELPEKDITWQKASSNSC